MKKYHTHYINQKNETVSFDEKANAQKYTEEQYSSIHEQYSDDMLEEMSSFEEDEEIEGSYLEESNYHTPSLAPPYYISPSYAESPSYGESPAFDFKKASSIEKKYSEKIKHAATEKEFAELQEYYNKELSKNVKKKYIDKDIEMEIYMQEKFDAMYKKKSIEKTIDNKNASLIQHINNEDIVTYSKNNNFLKFFKAIGQSVASMFGVKLLNTEEKAYIKHIEYLVNKKEIQSIIELGEIQKFVPKKLIKKLKNTVLNYMFNAEPKDLLKILFTCLEKNKSIHDEYLVPLLFSQSGYLIRLSCNPSAIFNTTLPDYVKSAYEQDKYIYDAQLKTFFPDYEKVFNYVNQRLLDENFRKQALAYFKLTLYNACHITPSEYYNSNAHSENSAYPLSEKLKQAGSSVTFLYTIYQGLDLEKAQQDTIKLEKMADQFDSFASIISKIRSKNKSDPQFFIDRMQDVFLKPSINLKKAFNVYKENNFSNPSNDLASHYDDLPIAAKNIIEKIHKDYSYITANISLISQSESIILQNVISKRIPETIQAYLDIPSSDRNKLTNHDGKNAQELIYDSLENLSHLFSHHVNNINSQKMSTLSANARYSSKIKNEYNDYLAHSSEENNTDTEQPKEKEINGSDKKTSIVKNKI